MADTAALSGTLRVLDTPRHDLLEVVRAEYASLLEAVDPRDVLVLKRHPEGLDALRRTLAATDTGPVSPRVESVPEHASKVLEEHDPTRSRLGYEERIELISLVIEGTDGTLTPYLERAAARDSFVRDLGQLLLAATRQRVRESDDDHLAACYRVMDRYHEVLRDRGHVERPAIVPEAVDLLEANADGLRDRVTDSFSAVLAVEFEEFRSLDRRYLAALTGDATLVCLGERHASVERTAVEPGPLEAIADGLTVEAVDRSPPDGPPHGPVTRFLATGREPSGGWIHRLTAQTKREQDEAVGAAVRSIVEGADDLDYADVAVAVPRVERVPEARRRLRDAGVPTDTLGTDALVADPVVNELYAVVTLCATADRGPLDGGPDERAIAHERLEARVEAPGDHLEAVRGRPVRAALTAWIDRTDLKDRIARTENWVDAREQFESVDRILEIAQFVTDSDLVGADWAGVRRMLRRTIEYDAPHVHAVTANPPAGGVSVLATAELKFDHRPVVFLLDLVDRWVPGEAHLTQLFPTDWVRGMDGFPAVTDPSMATVEETFAPVARSGAPTSDAFATYHAQRARRLLAIGTRAATRRCYWCSYERESGGLRRAQAPSRYVTMAAEAVAVDTTPASSAGAVGRRAGLEAVTAEPWSELERVLGEASVGGDADLRETEARFEEIALIAEQADLDPAIREAIRSQFEFAAGEVLDRE